MATWRTQSKYRNKKVVLDGITFDSKREAKRYRELLLMEQGGEIADIQRQVKFVLIPTQREPDTEGPRGGKRKGKTIEREITYIADFVYWKNGALVVEDTKGFRTTEYVIKRKLMLWVHGIRIVEI